MSRETSRWTFSGGSRPEGVVLYDEGPNGGSAKCHSHHDTDPARGQHSAYDLVRLHLFGELDIFDAGTPIAKLPSSIKMAEFARSLPEVQEQFFADAGFEDLDATDFGWLDGDVPATGSGDTTIVGAKEALPRTIRKPDSKLTDQANARRMQQWHREDLLSCGGAFFCWNKTYWRRDVMESEIAHLLCALSENIRKEANKLQAELDEKAKTTGTPTAPEQQARVSRIVAWAHDSAQHGRKKACMEELRSLLSVEASLFNTKPWLFNCLNGTIDLRTSELRDPSPTDFLTTCAPMKYDPQAQAPRFERFLRETYRSQAEIDFAKRWFGYCMTGETKEHAIVFHIGEGGNGKNKIMELMKEILGTEYYCTAAIGLLAAVGNKEGKGGPNPDLADLLGKRMVTMSETPDDMPVNESLLKQLTGGDAIRARQLFESNIEFNPTHKLQVFTNHEPRIIGVGRGIWRRILFLQYPNRYGTPAEIASGEADFLDDKNLGAVLSTEKAGVLRWLIEGAKEWYANGLQVPVSVTAETQMYRLRQDRIFAFLQDRTEEDPAGFVGAQMLYIAYKGWCASDGYRPVGMQRFGKEVARVLKRPPVKQARCDGFPGIKLTEHVIQA